MAGSVPRVPRTQKHNVKTQKQKHKKPVHKTPKRQIVTTIPTTSLSSLITDTPFYTQARNVNVYKYGKPEKKKTPEQRHKEAQRARRKDAEKAKYNKSLEYYDQQLALGNKNPELAPVKAMTPAQQRRLEIRKAMRQTFESGDLSHIPMMVQFLKKMHKLDKNDGKKTVINKTGDESDSENQGNELIFDESHVKRVQQDAQVLQKYGLLSNDVRLTDLTRPGYQHEQDLLNNSRNVATPLTRDPHAKFKQSGNALSRAMLSPLADMLNDGEGQRISGSSPGDISGPSGRKRAQPIANFGNVHGAQGDNQPRYQLKPHSRSISGDIVANIGFDNPEFGGGAGSPVFRLNPHGIETVTAEDGDDELLDRKMDAELALDNQGMLGLNDNIHHHHANELMSDQMMPALGFLRSFTAPREGKDIDPIADVDGLGDTVNGIGGLQRLPGHLPNQNQKKLVAISGRRARAVETIAKTTAAVLTKKQLLAHNKSLLNAMSPGLVRGQKESKDRHYVDLYGLGYEITRIVLSKDLATATIYWSSECLYPLKQMNGEHELERPILDIVHKTLHGDNSGRVELNPLNESMKDLANSPTHEKRRAIHDLGANFRNIDHQFTSRAYANERERMAQQQDKVEVFMDDQTGVVIKRELDTGQTKLISQGNPEMWELRGRFAKGSYVPGTIDLLPPQYRKKTQMMSKDEQAKLQRESLIKQVMELQNVRAGLTGSMDPTMTKDFDVDSFMKENGMYVDSQNQIRFHDEEPDAPMVTKDSLEKLLLSNDNTSRHSQLSLNTFHRCLSIVSHATTFYLNSIVPSIRWALGQSLNTKYVPQIKFEFDYAYGEAKTRAHNVNAVLQKQIQRQFAQRDDVQLVSIKDEDEIEQERNLPRMTSTGAIIPPKNTPIGKLIAGDLAKQREKELELLEQKSKLLKHGRLEEVQMIDEFIEGELRAETQSKLKKFETGEIDDFDDESEDIHFGQVNEPHSTVHARSAIKNPEEMARSEQILQDNIRKLKASAEMLKTGQENKMATSTRLRYHDITLEDKRKLVSIYLNLQPGEINDISEDRLETVMGMLRREMEMEQRKKEREELRATKERQGLSKAQIDAEMAAWDQRKQQELERDPEYDPSVTRWTANVDDEASKPTHLLKLMEDSEEEELVPVANKRGNLKPGTKERVGDYDADIATAFYKRQPNYQEDHKTIKTRTLQTPRGGPTIEVQGMDKDELMKFREQYVSGEQTKQKPTKDAEYLQFSDSEDMSSDDHTESGSNSEDGSSYESGSSNEDDSSYESGSSYEDDSSYETSSEEPPVKSKKNNSNPTIEKKQQQQQPVSKSQPVSVSNNNNNKNKNVNDKKKLQVSESSEDGSSYESGSSYEDGSTEETGSSYDSETGSSYDSEDYTTESSEEAPPPPKKTATSKKQPQRGFAKVDLDDSELTPKQRQELKQKERMFQEQLAGNMKPRRM